VDCVVDGEHSDVRELLRGVRRAEDRSVSDGRLVRRTQHDASHQLHSATRQRGQHFVQATGPYSAMA